MFLIVILVFQLILLGPTLLAWSLFVKAHKGEGYENPYGYTFVSYIVSLVILFLMQIELDDGLLTLVFMASLFSLGLSLIFIVGYSIFKHDISENDT